MKIGISGHQNIRPQSAVGWIEAALRAELRHQRASAGVSSLAAGADQIFAAIVLEMGLELEVIIPCAGYESAFGDDESRERFRQLQVRAGIHHLLDFAHPSEEAFLSAGREVVEAADLMIFVWDGLPSRGLGGTAEVFKYAQIRRRRLVHLNPTDSSVQRHFFT